MKKYEAVIFDLDGVICFTDHYHYMAWKTLADSLGIDFDERKNDRLRGVSRMESLEIVLEGYHGAPLSQAEKEKLADQKKIADGVQTYYDRFLGWSMEFGMASLARKRIIIAQLFKRIELDRGYNLHFEVDWNYEQFIDSVNVKGKQGITAVGITLPPKVRPKAGKTAKASQTAKNGRKRKAEPISA